MSVSVKIDYYKVVMPENAPSFGKILDRLKNLDNTDDKRLAWVDGQAHRLYKIEYDGRLYKGDMVRINMEQTATKAEVEGGLEPVLLEEDEGIGHETAFIYDTHYKTLLIQVNRRGITPSRFAHFYSRFPNVTGDVELRPIIRQDALERVKQLDSVHKFRIKIANSPSAQDLADESTTVSRLLDVAGEYEAPYVDLVLSAGRQWRNKELTFGNIIDTVHGWMTTDVDVDVHKITINGRTTEKETRKIDLIEDRLRDEVNVTPNDFRRLTYKARIGELESSFEQREGELKQIL